MRKLKNSCPSLFTVMEELESSNFIFSNDTMKRQIFSTVWNKIKNFLITRENEKKLMEASGQIYYYKLPMFIPNGIFIYSIC